MPPTVQLTVPQDRDECGQPLARGSHRELGPVWPSPAAELGQLLLQREKQGDRDPDESELAETVMCEFIQSLTRPNICL